MTLRRREFIAFTLVALAASPTTAVGQEHTTRRVGLLFSYGEADPEGQSRLSAFRGKLSELGWIEGRSLELLVRRTDGRPELIKSMSTELASTRPHVLVVGGAPSLVAMRGATKDIPIVFVFVSDPVGMGEIESLAKPGGNATGFTPFEPSLGGKWVELLNQLAPNITRVGIILNPKSAPNSSAFVSSAETAAAMLGLSIVVAHTETDAQIGHELQRLAEDPRTGLILVPDPFTATRRPLIVTATRRHRMPFVAPFRDFATEGSLASYGVNAQDEYRRAATYVDRILRGEKPAELPVQQPTKLELIINLKTAKTLGLTIPPTLLARADEVIE